MILVQSAELIFQKVRNRKEIKINQPTEVTIESTWKELTSRCEITLPRRVTYFDKDTVSEVFRTGDPVTVKLGYNGNLVEEFTGYIVSVSAEIPIKIKCEDEMWKLKQIPVNYSAPKAKLKTLLETICKGYSIDCEDFELGGCRYPKTTVAKVLDTLRQEPFNLNSYMRGKQLVCGKYYSTGSKIDPVKFNLETSIVTNSLQYKKKEDIVVQIKGKSVLSGGKMLEFSTGEEGGDTKELTYYNIAPLAKLKELVMKDYNQAKQDGFDGNFVAFGSPWVTHGRKVQLLSALYPDRTGIYYVEGVTKTFGSGGYRQQIKLGGRAV